MEQWLTSGVGHLIIGAMAGLLGSTLLNYFKGYIEQNYSRRDVLWRAELDYRERQLSEFYGPVYGMIKIEKDIYDLWTGKKLDDVNMQVKQYLDQHNKIIIDLIVRKAHLIESVSLPDSFHRFITHSYIFGFYAVPTEHGTVPTELEHHPRVEYPVDFDDHVVETTEKLKARIEFLHKKYAEPLP